MVRILILSLFSLLICCILFGTTALVLSGGGARGIAHLGAIKFLEKLGFHFDLVIGTSMGSIIGAGYACGLKPEEMERFLKEFGDADGLINALDISTALSRRGLFRRDVIERYLRKAFDHKTFDDTLIKLVIVAYDITSDELVLLDEGDIVTAILASTAIPGYFEPVVCEGRILVDGGIANRGDFPVWIARELGADTIIVVDVSPKWLMGGFLSSQMEDFADFVERWRKPYTLKRTDMFDILKKVLGSYDLFRGIRMGYIDYDGADVVIRPLPDDSSFFWAFDMVEELVYIGYIGALREKPNLEKLLEKLGKK